MLQRTTRGTSGHEDEELASALNEHARDGWRLRFVVDQTEFHQLYIFEREADAN